MYDIENISKIKLNIKNLINKNLRIFQEGNKQFQINLMYTLITVKRIIIKLLFQCSLTGKVILSCYPHTYTHTHNKTF